MINWRAKTKKVENNSRSMFRKVNGEIEFANLTGQFMFCFRQEFNFHLDICRQELFWVKKSTNTK